MNQPYEPPGGSDQPQWGAPQQGYPPPYGPPPGPPQPGFGPPPWQPTTPRRTGSPLGIGIAIAGALMAIGTLLPWISVKLQLGSPDDTPLSHAFSRSLSGISSTEGKIVMLCALVVIVFGVVAMANNGRLGLLADVPAVIAIVVILKVFGDKANYDSEAGKGLPAVLRANMDVSLLAGIYISLTMAVAVLCLSGVAFATSKAR
ncbi:hypothetical protein [Actinoallomurus iriomotensis]|uniref:Uncharacterized protein n=1 Tax=Actinoallomurus iriomotensis TaxID=478107 RepID=A0A9W6S9V6_9ACTN|nr:hypothetical protein [Actinoallomurus iriomotensis]GLY90019.1 hypothetical protein Airi02_079480 [Actinoallomurus iriomotensis]